jgi:hypothetical protein
VTAPAFLDLRFDRTLYAGPAVDEAIKVFARHGEFHMSEETDSWVVRLRALRPALTRRLAHELANYALGLTVQRGGV